MKTARFWIWHNDGWVRMKITDRDQAFEVVSGGPNEEGFSYTYQRFWIEGDCVFREVVTDARDCDGPLETYDIYRAYGTELECERGDDNHRRPKWEHLEGHRRDA